MSHSRCSGRSWRLLLRDLNDELVAACARQRVSTCECIIVDQKDVVVHLAEISSLNGWVDERVRNEGHTDSGRTIHIAQFVPVGSPCRESWLVASSEGFCIR